MLCFSHERQDWRSTGEALAVSVEQEVGGSSPPNCTNEFKVFYSLTRIRKTDGVTLGVTIAFLRLGLPDYESGGQEFESLRARQHLATTHRAKIIGLLRILQGSLA